MIPRQSLPFDITEEGFWQIVTKRQKIWNRRFELGEEPSWTDDPILQKYHFTNVYRELDRGTLWAIDNIIHPNRKRPMNMLWQSIVYRRCNRIETFEAVGIPHWKKFDAADFGLKLYGLRGAGKSVFSPPRTSHTRWRVTTPSWLT